ncbi:MAG: Uma2 family endonuclease [Kineosporiaceae bacterium]
MTARSGTPLGTRRLTVAEYLALPDPDDGQRYELVDGVVLVTPSPTFDHQWDSAQLHVQLFLASPPELRVLAAPFDVRLADDTLVRPDLVVLRRRDVVDGRLTGIPLLAVEFLSPSTRGQDLLLKRARYARAGIPSYWVVDPDTGEAVISELDQQGRYVDVARGRLRDADLSLDRPFPVTLRLTD